SRLVVSKENNILKLTAGDVLTEFDTRSGRIIRFGAKDGSRPIIQFPEPHFWRAPTDNDFGSGMQVQLGIWRTAHVNRLVKNITVGQESSAGIPVKVEYELSGVQVPYTIEYLFK